MSAKILFNQIETRLFKTGRNAYMAPEAITGAAKVQQDKIKEIVSNFELGMESGKGAQSLTAKNIEEKYDDAKKRIDEVAKTLGEDSKDFIQDQIKKLGEVKNRYAATLTALEQDKATKQDAAKQDAIKDLTKQTVFSLTVQASDVEKGKKEETRLKDKFGKEPNKWVPNDTTNMAARSMEVGVFGDSVYGRNTTVLTSNPPKYEYKFVKFNPENNKWENCDDPAKTVAKTERVKEKVDKSEEAKSKYEAALKEEIRELTEAKEGLQRVAAKQEGKNIEVPEGAKKLIDDVNGYLENVNLAEGLGFFDVRSIFRSVSDMEYEGSFSADENEQDEIVENYDNEARSATAGYVQAMKALGKSDVEIKATLREAYYKNGIFNKNISKDSMEKAAGLDMKDNVLNKPYLSNVDKFYIATLIKHAGEHFSENPNMADAYKTYIENRLSSAEKQLKELSTQANDENNGLDRSEFITKQRSLIITLVESPEKWQESVDKDKATPLDKKIGAAKGRLYEFYLRKDPGKWQKIPDEQGEFKMDKNGNIYKRFDDGYYVFNKDTNKFDAVDIMSLEDAAKFMGDEKLPSLKVAGLDEVLKSAQNKNDVPEEPNQPTDLPSDSKLAEMDKELDKYDEGHVAHSEGDSRIYWKKDGKLHSSKDGKIMVYEKNANGVYSPTLEGYADDGGSGFEVSSEEGRKAIREELKKESEKDDFNKTDNKFYKYEEGVITFKGDKYEIALRLADICDLICPGAKKNGCEVTHEGVTVTAIWNEEKGNFYDEKNPENRVKIFSGDAIKEKKAEDQKPEEKENEQTRDSMAKERAPEKAPETLTEKMQKIAKGSLQEWLEIKTNRDMDPDDTSDSKRLYIETTLDAVEENSNVSNELIDFTADRIAKRGIEATEKDVRDSLRAVKSIILNGKEYSIDLTNESSVETVVNAHLLYLEKEHENIKAKMKQTSDLFKAEIGDHDRLYSYIDDEHGVSLENREKMAGVLKHAVNEEIAKLNSDSIVKISGTPELYVKGVMEHAVDFYKKDPEKMENDYARLAAKEKGNE